MTDTLPIVERLIRHNQSHEPDVCDEAADLIEKLTEALGMFVTACDSAPPTQLIQRIGEACNEARAALELAKKA